MPLTKRIIACLDVQDGKTVKGVRFENIRDMGDPVALAAYYAEQGADELVFLDISATNERRKTLMPLVRAVAKAVNIPFTVGGGISDIEDVSLLLDAGADKVSVNTAAFRRPEMIEEIACRFGSQCLVVAIDTRYEQYDWTVFLNGGRLGTGVSTLDWAKRAVDCGAGEILLTAINQDGTGTGFATAHTRQVSGAVSVPVIASGGAGKREHFLEVLEGNTADAALAAGTFHSKTLLIPELKTYLKENGVAIRI
jgi:cyclase